ncbi:MAG: SDR family oxidoreductase [Acetobacteraceae bacterium]|nr:SDR family oxidoreductase [Acetobacteraceae bacterium]
MGVLDGKVAVITGATSGIGESTAELFVAEGATVILAGRRAEQGQAIAARLGQNAHFVRADMAREADITDLIQGTAARFGRIDVLFNNAGHGLPPFRIADADIATWDFMMTVHVRAVVIAMKCVAPIMQAQKSGSIITTASVAGYRAGGSSHAYSTAKAAVLHLTHSVAAELGEDNIRVNSISPGAIVTGIFGKGIGLDPNVADRELATLQARFAKAQPIPRPGLPDDIARAALFLASDASSFINGTDIVVDGGAIAGTRFSQGIAGRRDMTAAIEKAAKGAGM